MSTQVHFPPIHNKAKGNLFLDMRVRSLYSPYYFIKTVLGYDNLDPTFHLPELEIFVTAWSEGHTRQNVRWPRGWYKTTCFTIGMAIWVTLPVREIDTDYAVNTLGIPLADWNRRVALHDQDTTQLIAMETAENAQKKVEQIGWHFQENQLFRELFPEIAYTGKESTWNRKCIIIRRVGFNQKVSEGTFEAIGAGGALQSRHYKIVWEDDLIGKEALESEVVMASTIRWHGLLNGAFENVAAQVRFVIGNTWRLNDLNSYIAANEPEFLIHSRAAYETNKETGELESTAPNINSLEEIFAIRDGGSMALHDFCAQYLNQPRPEGEAEINRSAIHHYTVKQGMIHCSCGLVFHPKETNRYLHYDPYNAKGVGSKSLPAIIACGAGPEKHVVIFDIYNRRGEYTEVFKRIFEFNTRWQALLMTYEDVANQNMAEFHIRQIQKTDDFARSGFSPIRRFEPVKNTKEKMLRIRSGILNAMEHITITLNEKHAALEEQLLLFPNEAFSHDYDLLDALNQGVGFWQFPVAQEYADQQQASESEVVAALGKPFTFRKQGAA